MHDHDIEDQIEIQRLLTRYARAVDTKDWELYRSLFTEDAILDYSSAPLGNVGPRDEITDWLSGWYEKDYTTYGYDFGTFGSRYDLFDESLIRIENRLAALIPPPVRKLPILIGGTGPKRSLPAVARHADIWHAFQDLDAFRRSSDRVDELAATFGRNGADIERSTLWENAHGADAFREEGVTLFQIELSSDDGYDLTSLKQVLTWRDNG